VIGGGSTGSLLQLLKLDIHRKIKAAMNNDDLILKFLNLECLIIYRNKKYWRSKLSRRKVAPKTNSFGASRKIN
jgi:hypothetical protein